MTHLCVRARWSEAQITRFVKDRMRVSKRSLITAFAVLTAVSLGVLWWERAPSDSSIVTHFGRPLDIATYIRAKAWDELAGGIGRCFATSVLSLMFSGLVAVGMLVVGARSSMGLRLVERIAAASQAIPMLVIATTFLLLERGIVRAFHWNVPLIVYCLGPVTVSLLFPPLVNGAEAVYRLSIDMKYMLRLWSVPPWRRVWRVYLPVAIPEIMTGLRTSATWAVGATLITEGLMSGIEGSSESLGYLLIRAFSTGLTERTTTVLLAATMLAFLVYGLVAMIQRKLELKVLGKTAVSHADYPLQMR